MTTKKTKKTTKATNLPVATFYNRKESTKHSGEIRFGEINDRHYGVCDGHLYVHCPILDPLLYAVSKGCEAMVVNDTAFLRAEQSLANDLVKDKALAVKVKAHFDAIATILGCSL